LDIVNNLQKAIEHHQLGQVEEAERLYYEILKIAPKHPEANHNLATLLMQKDQVKEALPLFLIALESNPDSSQFWVSYINTLIHLEQYDVVDNILKHGRNSGLKGEVFDQFEDIIASKFKENKKVLTSSEVDRVTMLFSKGKIIEALDSLEVLTSQYPDEAKLYIMAGLCCVNLKKYNLAIKNYQRAIKIKPDYAEAYYMLGKTFRDLGQLRNAIFPLKQSIIFKSNYFDAYTNLALSLYDLGHAEEAITYYEQAIKIKPDSSELNCNLGLALHSLNQYDAAIKSYGHALKINPCFAEVHCNLGLVFSDLGQFDAAIKSYEHALKINPNFAEAHNNLGIVLRDLDQLDAAIKCHEQALKIKPDFAEAYSNLGVVFSDLRQQNNAIKCFENALKINPDLAETHNNLGKTYVDINQVELAITSFKQAIKINPNVSEAKFNLSLLQLDNDYLFEGFKNYEARWKWDKFPSHQRRFSISRWNGESLQGKNILLWAEQGIGDEIQFASLIPEFKNLKCYVLIECAAKLVEIFQWSFPWAEVRETGAINCEGDEGYRQFDYQIPMGSIAPFFRTTLDDFRNYQKPFIPRLKEGELKVRKKLNLEDGQLLIGLCWRSGLQKVKNSFHYLSVEDLAPFQSIKNSVFLGLQYDDCLPELDHVRELGLPIRYYTNIDQKNDLASASALIGACDLVISASTAVFQMSGALGVPTIMFDGYKSKNNRIPWHPTVRYFSLNSDDPLLLITNIINQMPELIAWVNEVTTSGRNITNPYTYVSG
jgi:tetratricopeptide (TPR) repeat protein